MTTKARAQALEAMIEAYALELKLPTLRRRFRALAAEALREQQTPLAYLAALLEAEMHERAERRERRRMIDARFPLVKRLEDFRYEDNPSVSPTVIGALAEGGWIDDHESVILVGESGTGKTMLATGLAVVACQQGRRVRFTTLAGLATELQEAESRRELARVVGRYARTELVVLDELGYLALPEGAAELVFQVILRAPRARIADRDEQPALRRVGQGVQRPALGQGRRRPHHPPRPHHRDRIRELEVSPSPGARRPPGPGHARARARERADVSAPPEGPCVTARVTDRPACAACGRPLVGAPADARHCSAACRQRAYRARRGRVALGAGARTPPERTIYECPSCAARLLGAQRCEDCGIFCRRIGPGGACPHCDEPVAISDLVNP